MQLEISRTTTRWRGASKKYSAATIGKKTANSSELNSMPGRDRRHGFNRWRGDKTQLAAHLRHRQNPGARRQGELQDGVEICDVAAVVRGRFRHVMGGEDQPSFADRVRLNQAPDFVEPTTIAS